jgi:two-component system, LuxR family, sensor kinase FixL
MHIVLDFRALFQAVPGIYLVLTQEWQHLPHGAFARRGIAGRKPAIRRPCAPEHHEREMSRLSAMGQMASSLAHELNQPLAAISNYLQGSRRLLEHVPDERSAQLREALDKAGEQALRTGQIIRRLRDFFARGETEWRIEGIKRLVEGVSVLVLVAAKEQSVRVTFQFVPSVDFVLIDKVQVQQVLLNLLRNAMEALEASDRREPVVSTAPAADDMIAVSIADTGAGIDPRIASQLFQPFITTKREGTGIGLSISRSIIESHGSEITMEAQFGWWIDLPFHASCGHAGGA